MRYLHVFVLSLVACVAFAAHAIDIDQSSPKATALSFAKAIEAADAAAAKQLAVGTEQDQLVLEATVEFTGAVKKFREAATKKFGEKADEATGGGLNLDSAKSLEDAQINETGDTATVVVTKPQPGTTYLKKVDGKWVVNLTDTLKGAAGGAGDVGQYQTLLKSFTSAIADTTAEIDAGKYQAAAEVPPALQAKMMASLKGGSSAATQPTEAATQPSK